MMMIMVIMMMMMMIMMMTIIIKQAEEPLSWSLVDGHVGINYYDNDGVDDTI